MAKVKIQGNASGTGVVTLTAPNTNSDRTITLPDGTGELLAKDSSGNVGIGTSSPSAKMHITSSSNQLTISEGSSLGATFDYQSSTGALKIATNGFSARTNPDLTIDLNGNVGIGTSSPTDKLCVAVSQSTGVETGVVVAHASNYPIGGMYSKNVGGYNQDLIFKTSTTSNASGETERMRIDSVGRVTMPYQPSFWASCTETNYANPGTGKLNMGSVQYNRGGNYNASTSEFTAPVSGVYRVWLGVFSTSDSGTSERYQIVVNGAGISYPYILGGGFNHQPISGSMDIQLSANDSVYIGVVYSTQAIYAGHTGWGMTLLG